MKASRFCICRASSRSRCVPNTFSCRACFRGSSKRTVAAQWKTILIRVRSSSSSSALMASLGWVSSALIGLIFSWKLGQSSRTLSKTLKHKQREIRYRIGLLRSLWLADSLIIPVKWNWHKREFLVLSEGGHRWDDKIVNSFVPSHRKTSHEKQNKNTGGNELPWRDEWLHSAPLISWDSHWKSCVPTSPATTCSLTSKAAYRTVTGAKEQGRVRSGKACESLDSSSFLDGFTKDLSRGGHILAPPLPLLLLAYCHSLFMSDESCGKLPSRWKDGESQ